jgi:zinc protease
MARRPMVLPLALALGCAAAPARSSARASSALATMAAAPAATSPATSPALPRDPSITSGTCENGFSYYLKRQRAQDRRVRLLLVVRAGSLHEEDDQRGGAHLIEHLAFSGTQHFPKLDLERFFAQAGMGMGSHVQGETSHERTQYGLNVPTDDPQLLATALDILADWAGGMAFAPDALERERAVVLSEWLAGYGARKRIHERIRDVLLAGSPYAQRTIGSKAGIEQLQRDRLLAFYRRWYRPERMALIAVGDIDPRVLEQAVRSRFSAMPAGSAQSAPAANVPVGVEPVAAVVTSPEVTATQLSLLFKSPVQALRSEADYRARLLSKLIASMLNHRLEALRLPDSPLSKVGATMIGRMFDPLDVLMVAGNPKADQLMAGLEALSTELERVIQHGFTSAELARVAAETRRHPGYAAEDRDPDPIATMADILRDGFIHGDTVVAPKFARELESRLLEQLGAEEVSEAARQLLRRSQEVVLVSGAAPRMPLDQGSLLAALARVKSRRLEPYRDADAADLPLLQAPTPGRIVSEAQIVELGVSVWTLSNGARVVLKPTDFARNEVLERSISPGGNARVPRRDLASAMLAPEIVRASGIGPFDPPALKRLLDRKETRASPWIDEFSEGIDGRAPASDVETLFQLIHLYATAARRDAPAFEAWKTQLRVPNGALSSVFDNAIAQKLWGDEPRRLAPTPAFIDQIVLDEALRFYAERFADMSDFTFVFVGNVDLVAFRPLVERYLASLPGKGRKETVHDLGLHPRAGVTRVTVRAAPEDWAAVQIRFFGKAQWSLKADTDLSFLRRYLAIRLMEVLREQLGATYNVRVESDFDRVPAGAYRLTISFECEPPQVERLEQAVRDVIADTKRSGINASYLERISKEHTRYLEEVARSNAFWLTALRTQYQLGEDPRIIAVFLDPSPRPTGDDVRRAARRFLRDDQYLDARLLPVGAPTPRREAPAAAPASSNVSLAPAPGRAD